MKLFLHIHFGGKKPEVKHLTKVPSLPSGRARVHTQTVCFVPKPMLILPTAAAPRVGEETDYV